MPRHPDSHPSGPRRSDPSATGNGVFSCAQAAELLEPHADGELAGAPLATLTAHLARCPACSRELAHALDLAAALRGLPELTCPARVKETVLATAARDQAARDHVVRDPITHRPATRLRTARDQAAQHGPSSRSNLRRFATPAPAQTSIDQISTAQTPTVPSARLWRPALAAALVTAAVGGALFLDRQASRSAAPTDARAVHMTPEELARAEVEVKLAFAYLNQVGREAGTTVRDEMITHVVAPTHRALQ